MSAPLPGGTLSSTACNNNRSGAPTSENARFRPPRATRHRQFSSKNRKVPVIDAKLRFVLEHEPYKTTLLDRIALAWIRNRRSPSEVPLLRLLSLSARQPHPSEAYLAISYRGSPRVSIGFQPEQRYPHPCRDKAQSRNNSPTASSLISGGMP